MSRTIRMLYCCVIVTAMGVVGVATASATFTLTEVECTAGAKATLCWGPTESGKLFENKGEESIKVKQETAFRITAASISVEIECSELEGKEVVVHQTEPLVKAYDLTGQLVFKNCKIVGQLEKKCALVSSTIVTEILLGEPNSASTTIKLEPTSGATGKWLTVEIVNKGTETCPSTVKGSSPVSGTQTCNVPNNGVLAKVHLLECLASGSTLKFGGSTMTLEGTAEGELISGDLWDGGEY